MLYCTVYNSAYSAFNVYNCMHKCKCIVYSVQKRGTVLVSYLWGRRCSLSMFSVMCSVTTSHAGNPGFDSGHLHNPWDWWFSPVTLLLGVKDIGMKLVELEMAIR